ncbi:Elongation of very long chain fatty acids protein [Operophtera brumata]|uniref:Elongation of very long chain fatty acids protein n=1 Tax=Operophtera brumata TaxID=104452 RepID=A0A0L7KMB8_OPEBR|nr:Elongation of very long chain fatty acids protein [Operophtera brumata]
MYSYYLLAALGPKVQFVLVFLHAFQLLFQDCDYPRAFVWWIGMHAVLFYYLFSDFYKQAYRRKGKRVKAKLEDEAVKPESMKRPLLNGFSNGSALNDVHQRVAGAVATQ